MTRRNTRGLIAALLLDGKVRSQREIASELGLGYGQVNVAVYRAWEKGCFMRSKEVFFEGKEFPRGPLGLRKAIRAFHKYTLPIADSETLLLDGITYVGFSREYFDHRSRRSAGGKSKSRLVLEFLMDNRDRAWFSTEILGKLSNMGVKPCDVMPAARRYQKRGWILVRGYNSDNNSTPFRQGFLLTYINQDMPQQRAISEAYDRTEAALSSTDVKTPLAQRIHRLRGMLIESAKAKEIMSPTFIKNQLKCTDEELEVTLRRSKQLYPDVREEKLFGAYRYFYHSSISPEELKATIEMKKNYIRMSKGKESRVGHNWEAACEFFIDKFQTGATFRTQSHRVRMDPRRITIHLIKPVGQRINNAEVDRVWETNQGVLALPTTYVLECKWGLVSRKYIDDFFEVLRWSNEFGADSPDGRVVKQGVIGIFAGAAFNPNEMLVMKDGSKLNVPSYAARNNIQLLRASRFNTLLHQHGAPKECTVQKVCRVAKDEADVRQILEEIWKDPQSWQTILRRALDRNKHVFDLESLLGIKEADSSDALEQEEEIPTPLPQIKQPDG